MARTRSVKSYTNSGRATVLSTIRFATIAPSAVRESAMQASAEPCAGEVAPAVEQPTATRFRQEICLRGDRVRRSSWVVSDLGRAEEFYALALDLPTGS